MENEYNADLADEWWAMAAELIKSAVSLENHAAALRERARIATERVQQFDRSKTEPTTIFEEARTEACASENHYRCNEAFPDCWCRRCHAVPEEYDNPA